MKLINYVGRQLTPNMRVNISIRESSNAMGCRDGLIKFTTSDGNSAQYSLSYEELKELANYASDCVKGKGDCY